MREAVVKDWYGKSCENVNRYIDYFNEIIDKNVDKQKAKEIFSLKPKALIVPHAGWMYSGFTANFAYRIAKNSNAKRVAVIGPSHKFAFDGISITLEDSYETPCKNLPIDTQLAKELIDKFDVQNLEYVHTEHSTEVQMPFIAHYFNNIKVIEMIYSNYNPANLSEIIEYLIKNNVLVVISSDLSHYYDIKTANQLDYNCIEAVLNEDISFLDKCEACGKIGIEALILSSKRLNLTPLLVDYRTSADVSQDESNVVGYMSAIML